jgi:hypothetical protein
MFASPRHTRPKLSQAPQYLLFILILLLCDLLQECVTAGRLPCWTGKSSRCSIQSRRRHQPLGCQQLQSPSAQQPRRFLLRPRACFSSISSVSFEKMPALCEYSFSNPRSSLPRMTIRQLTRNARISTSTLRQSLHLPPQFVSDRWRPSLASLGSAEHTSTVSMSRTTSLRNMRRAANWATSLRMECYAPRRQRLTASSDTN